MRDMSSRICDIIFSNSLSIKIRGTESVDFASNVSISLPRRASRALRAFSSPIPLCICVLRCSKLSKAPTDFANSSLSSGTTSSFLRDWRRSSRVFDTSSSLAGNAGSSTIFSCSCFQFFGKATSGYTVARTVRPTGLPAASLVTRMSGRPTASTLCASISSV